ncbi:MAG: Asp23/Gls24 family envelope stress response protein [Clostridia bacterium]|nr:Asp23/Gls24 family envelope stress response protein [Clostridia bacterium]
MPGLIVNDLGKITLSDELLASIAGYAAMENYGIVGMSAKKASDTFFQLIGSENNKRGVAVTTTGEDGSIDVDLYVTLMYGVSLPAVAENARRNVRYRIEEMTGLKVRNVNIHVESIKV